MQTLVEHARLGGHVQWVGAGHDENILARAHIVVGGAGFRVAAIAAGGLVLGFLLGVGGFDFREGHRILPQTMEGLVLAADDLPIRILRRRYAAGAEGRTVRHGILATIQMCLDVVGGTMAVLHGHDDGGAAEGAIAPGENFGVRGAHGFPIGAHAVYVHQPSRFQFLALAFLADGENHQATCEVVFAATDIFRLAAAILAGFTQLRDDAAQGKALVRFDRGHGLRVVQELHTLLDGSVELILARRYFLGTPAIDHLDLLATRKTQCGATGIHRHVAAAHDDDGLGHRRAFARIDAAKEAHAIDDTRIIPALNVHGFTPPRSDGQ